jgi:hypothetical protein
MQLTRTDLNTLLETSYRDLPINTLHEVLGSATFYLDSVYTSGSIPGIEGTVIPDMRYWCEVPPRQEHIHACLAGIWYMHRVGTLLDAPTRLDYPGDNILGYLDKVTHEVHIHNILGLEGVVWGVDFSVPYSRLKVVDVIQRLHTLLKSLPVSMTSYNQLSLAYKYAHPTLPLGCSTMLLTRTNSISTPMFVSFT